MLRNAYRRDSNLNMGIDGDIKSDLLAAILPHVAFDGWSDTAFQAACSENEIDLELARLACPRGPLDLAILFHRNGDQAMKDAIENKNMDHMRFREKVETAIRIRLDLIHDKEAVRRAASLFALPQNSTLGIRLTWETSDAIWTVLNDPSKDINWYTKRLILSTVYGASVLYWLGDDSPDHMATWDFVNRRIEDVMQFEQLKNRLRSNQSLKKFRFGPSWLIDKIRAPRKEYSGNMPGYWNKL